ncbi:MAG: hypothetical protein LBD04_12240 [Synergistaceae bacterium]|nr:hypothetical protein [Synergistaceae bacterium]
MKKTAKTTGTKCLNTRLCPCPKEDCANHAVCCACVERHRGLGNLPNCLR